MKSCALPRQRAHLQLQKGQICHEIPSIVLDLLAEVFFENPSVLRVVSSHAVDQLVAARRSGQCGLTAAATCHHLHLIRTCLWPSVSAHGYCVRSWVDCAERKLRWSLAAFETLQALSLRQLTQRRPPYQAEIAALEFLFES